MRGGPRGTSWGNQSTVDLDLIFALLFWFGFVKGVEVGRVVPKSVSVAGVRQNYEFFDRRAIFFFCLGNSVSGLLAIVFPRSSLVSHIYFCVCVAMDFFEYRRTSVQVNSTLSFCALSILLCT